MVVAVNSICRGSGLISQEAQPGALLLLPVTPGIRRCDMPSASLSFPRLPPVLLQFPLPKIYASCNWSVRRRRAEATTQILSWVYFPEQERRRKCSDLASFREQTVRLWEAETSSLGSDHRSAVGLAPELKVWTSTTTSHQSYYSLKLVLLAFWLHWPVERGKGQKESEWACSREQISHSSILRRRCGTKSLFLNLGLLLIWTLNNFLQCLLYLLLGR